MELRKEHRSPHSRARRLAAAAAICAAALWLAPTSAFAQLDPLLFLQRSQPNVIIAVDVANRMQFDGRRNVLRPVRLHRDGRGVGSAARRRAGRDDVPPRVQVACRAAPVLLGHVHRRENRHARQHRCPVQRVLVADAPGRGARGPDGGGPAQRPRGPIRPREDAAAEPAHRRPGQRGARLREGSRPRSARRRRARATGAGGSPPPSWTPRTARSARAAAPVVAADSAGASTSVATILSRAREPARRRSFRPGGTPTRRSTPRLPG